MLGLPIKGKTDDVAPNSTVPYSYDHDQGRGHSGYCF